MKKYNLTIEEKSFEVEVDVHQNTAEVVVNGKSYVVEIEFTDSENNKVTRPAVPKQSVPKTVVPELQPTIVGISDIIKSPLPGVIMNVLVNKGDKVKRGDVIIIIEAMKMENNVMAVADGTVKNVFVETGKTVMMGDNLIDIEIVKN